MRKINLAPALTSLITLSLLISLCAGVLITDQARAESHRDATQKASKVSSDLRHGQKHSAGEDRVRIILQLKGKMSGQLNALLNRNGVHVRGEFRNFNSLAVELPASVVDELALYSEVQYVSADREVISFGDLSATTGADAVRLQTTSTGLPYTLDGRGIGIAFLDSGIDPEHYSFTDASGSTSRIIVNRDFTGEGRTDDPYGHGTHVASIAAGNARVDKGKYIGVAPEARIINLRVLNGRGTGSVSGVLSALDWVMNNRLSYSIRIVNMSLGMPAIDSYRDDPICRAVRRLVDSGVVVVAAAGNNGKDEDKNKVYGQIHSPGNEPSALTVGATNTDGTIDRGDDEVATFSSRGPTRSYWTDASGLNHYDNLLKPDLVAPGNKIVGAEARSNYLVKQYPALDASKNGNARTKMMSLNGTSMAAPVAAGAAALMLQANPNLTPNMVKALLMYTAQSLAGYNMFEQGAGEINVEGAVRLAKLVRSDLKTSTPVGSPMLKTTTPPLPQTTITYQGSSGRPAVCTFAWSQGLILNYGYATGSALILNYQGIYGTGVVLGDGVIFGDGVVLGDMTLWSSGIVFGDQILTSMGITLSEGTVFTSSGVLLGDGLLLSDGVVLGDGVLISDGVMIGDGGMMSESAMQAYSALIDGDPTSSSD